MQCEPGHTTRTLDLRRPLFAWLAIGLSTAAAFGQPPPERLPPVAQPPPYYRVRQPLWPEFAWGAVLPTLRGGNPALIRPSAEPNAWLRAEYVQFFAADQPYANPVLTAGDSVLFGEARQQLNPFSGVRLTGGSWFNGRRVYGAEVSAFVLPTKVHHFQTASSSLPGDVLALPYTAEIAGQALPSSIVLAQPGVSHGSVQIQTSTYVWGIEANALRMICQAPPLGDTSFLAGVRFLQLGERFAMSSQSLAAGTTVDRYEGVHTQASFIGVQFGGRTVRRWGRFSLQATGKAGLGATNNLVTLLGQNNGFTFGSPDPSTAATDIARNYLYDFSVVPEAQLRLSYDLRPGWRLSAGYDFLFWTRVLRPGNQLDNRVDFSNPTAPLTAPIAPSPLDKHSNFWLQGWNVAVEWVR